MLDGAARCMFDNLIKLRKALISFVREAARIIGEGVGKDDEAEEEKK